MYATKYDPKVDNWSILQVLKKREMRLSLVSELPAHGIAVYEEDHFIAAGFIRQCEGGYGMFDSYISNPKMPAPLRNQALELVMRRLLKQAKELKLKKIFGFSTDNNTITRSQRHGFALSEHKVLVRAV